MNAINKQAAIAAAKNAANAAILNAAIAATVNGNIITHDQHNSGRRGNINLQGLLINNHGTVVSFMTNTVQTVNRVEVQQDGKIALTPHSVATFTEVDGTINLEAAAAALTRSAEWATKHWDEKITTWTVFYDPTK